MLAVSGYIRRETMDRTVAFLYNPAMHDTPAPPPGLLVAGHFRQGAGYATQRRNGTRDWLIAYTVAGTGRYHCGGATVLAQPGDVTLLDPGVPHDYATAAGGRWEFFWAHFVPRPPWRPWLQMPVGAGGLRRLTISSRTHRSRLVDAFSRLVTDAVALPAYGALAEEMALNDLEEVVLLCALEMAGSRAQRLDPRIRQVLAAIATDLAGVHPIAGLAAQVALSPSRLAHLFKAETGASVLDTHLHMRLYQASRLLAYTAQDVAQISRSVGYRSPYFFSRQFRQRYGMSPSRYRATITVQIAGQGAERNVDVAGRSGQSMP
ncbi:MAG: helix-turn-helix domain-containing protein [Chloroflexota bacterium]